MLPNLPQLRLGFAAHFLLLGLLLFLGSTRPLLAQVGIGTTTPKAFLHVPQGRTVLFGSDSSGMISSGTIDDYYLDYPKLIWYGSKGAFRAGATIGNNKWNNTNVGMYSFASGLNTLASGSYATAMGYNTTASSNNSTAMGSNVSTNSKSGSFIIGDNNSDGYVYNNSADNQMMMHFSGGYILYTSSGAFSAGTALGVQVASGGNAWTTISDSTRKENFRAANGTDFLQKIARMRLGSWNYKGQDAKTYRHYGPMAQDFFAAFGHDGLGTIGEDKSINQADFDGVNLIAIQALIKKVEKLEAENSTLKQQLHQETASLRSELDSIKRLITSQASLSQNFAK